MMKEHIIETFNTHRMSEEVVLAVATSRGKELNEIMSAVRQAIDEPKFTPQHLVVYGERGAGKSFLMRLVEIEIGRLSKDENKPVAAVLLPEEQYNIRSITQLLGAVSAYVNNKDWSESVFTFDFRPQGEAWAAAVDELNTALDARFGQGRGLAVVMLENFDLLAKDLFGSESTTNKRNVSSRALEQGAAEQLLRRLLNNKSSRFMLVASATGTVDQDYERPLFQVFKPIDLEAWTSDDCIAYFNRRRVLAKQPELSAYEQARVRAIARFIGGNPRLAQLLGDVLDTRDAHSIASTLDTLSDHLADYYRRRLDDLSPQSAALLDALIRGGEPSTQSGLAERVKASSQSQIADAFSRLVQSRLLIAESEIGGAGTLYRVRDRLFVHFYRRRYGTVDQRNGLAPLADLLERFFTSFERETLAQRHLEAGEWADARVLVPERTDNNNIFCSYKDRPFFMDVDGLFLASEYRESSFRELNDEIISLPEHSVRRWSEVARSAQNNIVKVASLAIEAVALARCNLDGAAHQTLLDASQEVESDADSRVVAKNELAKFLRGRKSDAAGAIKLINEVAGMRNSVQTNLARYLAIYAAAYISFVDEEYEKAVEMFAVAECIAAEIGIFSWQSQALTERARALVELSKFDEALDVAVLAIDVAKKNGEKAVLPKTYRTAVSLLGKQGNYGDALKVGIEFKQSAQEFCDDQELAIAEFFNAVTLQRLGKISDAVDAIKQSIVVFRRIESKTGQIRALLKLSDLLALSDFHQDALNASQEAVGLARSLESEKGDLLFWSYLSFFQRAKFVFSGDVARMFDEAMVFIASSKDVNGQFELLIDNVLAAVARADAWSDVFDVFKRHGLVVNGASPKIVFNGVGEVWADRSRIEGRAGFYKAVSSAMPFVRDIMEIVPHNIPLEVEEERKSIDLHLRDLVLGAIKGINSSGVIRDFWELLSSTFGEAVENWSMLFDVFDDYHRASNKNKVLQQLNPDFATLIRTLLSLPEPEDSLKRRGRRKGR